MRVSRKIVQALFFALVLTGWPVIPVSADNIPLAPTPAPETIPTVSRSDPNSSVFSRAPDGFDIGVSSSAIADALAGGGRAYYIGRHADLDGWLLVKGNEIQVVYATADRKTLLIGLLFGSDGYNITSDQVQELIRKNPQAASEMSVMMRQQLGIGVNEGPAMSSVPMMPKFGSPGGQSSSAAQQDPSEHAAKQLLSDVPPGERLLLDLQNAAGVDVGDSQAPVLYMVIDTDNPHCQATWRVLRDAVFKKTLRIHLIPLGKNDAEENAAVQLLRSANPLTSWDKYVGGDKTQLAGTPDPKFWKV